MLSIAASIAAGVAWWYKHLVAACDAQLAAEPEKGYVQLMEL